MMPQCDRVKSPSCKLFVYEYIPNMLIKVMEQYVFLAIVQCGKTMHFELV
jgi:hypothetical protein